MVATVQWTSDTISNHIRRENTKARTHHETLTLKMATQQLSSDSRTTHIRRDIIHARTQHKTHTLFV